MWARAPLAAAMVCLVGVAAEIADIHIGEVCDFGLVEIAKNAVMECSNALVNEASFQGENSDTPLSWPAGLTRPFRSIEGQAYPPRERLSRDCVGESPIWSRLKATMDG